MKRLAPLLTGRRASSLDKTTKKLLSFHRPLSNVSLSHYLIPPSASYTLSMPPANAVISLHTPFFFPYLVWQLFLSSFICLHALLRHFMLYSVIYLFSLSFCTHINIFYRVSMIVADVKALMTNFS